MSFGVLLGLVLFASLAVATTFFIGSVTYVRGEVSELLPPELALAVDGPLRTLLTSQAATLFVLGLLLSIIIYFVLIYLIARPVKRLEKAMNQYAETGERVSIPDIEMAPREVKSLAVSFDTLVDRIGEGRKHDADMARVKSDFISTAAHQLRTPLTGIRWAHEALLKEKLTESQKVLVESAVEKSKDLVAIVGTLLDISAIESGKYKYVFQPVDMGAVLEELAHDFAPIAADAKVTFFFSREEGIVVPPARADRERIKWVLNNLIENAIVYTPPGGTVRLSLSAAEHRVFIKVKDSGIGIAPEDRANIFERFYRAKNAIDKQQKGNGLGLYIARTIATDHGGDLSFGANTEGSGTTFTLSLPVA
jgi:signal transduction histidine kinase